MWYGVLQLAAFDAAKDCVCICQDCACPAVDRHTELQKKISQHVSRTVCTFQLTSNVGEPNLLTAKTGDQYWRLVRKGVAAAFNPQNIRCVGSGSFLRHVVVQEGFFYAEEDKLRVLSPEDHVPCL